MGAGVDVDLDVEARLDGVGDVSEIRGLFRLLARTVLGTRCFSSQIVHLFGKSSKTTGQCGRNTVLIAHGCAALIQPLGFEPLKARFLAWHSSSILGSLFKEIVRKPLLYLLKV